MLPTSKSSKRIIFLWLLSLLFIHPTFGQKNSFELAAPVAAVEEVDMEPVNWIEDIDKRTLLSSTYHSNDSQIKIIQSSRPINYYNSSNELVPIDGELQVYANNEWAALNQPYPTYVNLDGGFDITGLNNERITLGRNVWINGESVSQTMSFTDGESVIFHLDIPGVEKELFFRENGVKYNYLVHQALPSLPMHIFSDEIDLPKNHSIRRSESMGREVNGEWVGNLEVIDALGRIVSTIHAPMCFDNNNNYIIASYRIRQFASRQFVDICVPGSWMNDPARSFPIVIDPLVTGPTASWLGGDMPSCFDPSYNQDSILVTIPGGVAVTQLNVTASYYADPFTGAVMGDGSMYFTTDCGNSQTFTIVGAPGSTPGTAYLDNFNLYNPLTCCFPEDCADQTFYLSMHLGRDALGAGCNTTYIRYDPVTTSWPYQATIVGKTVEAYSAQWAVPSSTICSNKCTINGTAYAYFGVPPYTFTHPWSNDTIIDGVNNGCASGATNALFTLNIPNCPDYCDTNFTSLDVPPPTITDACGNVVTGLPTRTVPIKTAPDISASYDTLVCSEEAFIIDLESCLPLADIIWIGNSNSGTTDIYDTLINNSTGTTSVTYSASASYNGCLSDTVDITVNVKPLPIVDYTYDPDPIVSGLATDFTDQTQFNVGYGVLWVWNFGDNSLLDIDQNPQHTYSFPGQYLICLDVVDDSGCQDSICKLITVVPVEITGPNIVTPNNDEINDLLAFEFLEFYPDNDLTIFNRWGNLLYYQSGYMNDWDGSAYTEGTYYYILNIHETGRQVQSFFQLVK